MPVSPDEKARVKLMNFKMIGPIYALISRFQYLVEICSTPLFESYLFFFSGLPSSYKQEFTKLDPKGEPKATLDVFEHARTFDLSLHWARQDDKAQKPDRKKKPTPVRSSGDKRDPPTRSPKDPNAVSWGP